jgi:hypothetical protein
VQPVAIARAGPIERGRIIESAAAPQYVNRLVRRYRRLGGAVG